MRDANRCTADNRPMAARSAHKRIPPGLLLWCLIVVGVFVAWQAHELWIAPKLDAQAALPGETGQASDTRRGPDIGEILRRPILFAGLRRLEGEPGGIAAADNARRRDGYERISEGRVEQFATYSVVAETFDEVVEHYRHAMSDEGFKLLGERTEEDARVLVYRRGDTQAVLRLRRDGENEMMLTLSVILPADSGGESGKEL